MSFVHVLGTHIKILTQENDKFLKVKDKQEYVFLVDHEYICSISTSLANNQISVSKKMSK